MPFYVVNPGSLEVEKACARSPVISLMTDAASEDCVPACVRGASDRVVTGALSFIQKNSVPAGSDAAILWIEGDQLLQGSGAALRRKAFCPGPRVLVPVHLPCLPEIDLVGLQPRVWTKAQGPDVTGNDIRIAGTVSPSPEVMSILEESNEPWARLSCALLAEQKAAGGGIEPLSKMWRDSTVLPPVYGALLMRNLIVLQIRQNKLEQAEHLLNLAMDSYPRYAELSLLAGWICISQDKLRKAGRHVQQAMENFDLSFVGSGGESAYRAQWLLGLAAELCGKQALAIPCYKMGVAARPAFPPAVLGMLRQRLAYSDAGNLGSWVLLSLAHREPQYLEMIFHFLLIHRQFQPAGRLLDSPHISEDVRQRLRELLDKSSAAYRPSPRAAGVKAGVMLIGPFCVNSSLARINRELAAAMAAARDFEVATEPHGFGDILGTCVPHSKAILAGYKHRLSRLDLTIRHHWPPDFEPGPCGKLICIFPWEYNAVPQKWIEQIKRNVTEVWTPSQFIKNALTAGGVQEDRIQVIPNGVDTKVFSPDGPVWRPEGCRGFIFLFVGGAIQRKGVDVLWNAYARAFSCGEDVTLIIKDIGAGTFYSSMSLLEPIRASARYPQAPHLVTLSEELDDSKLAALYRGCNAFVLPYRGEGFGMPLAEALACGKPVITTGSGPAREFCPPEASYFISARVAEFSNPQNQFGPMTCREAWFEPDADELARTMRHVFEHREGAARQGALGAKKVRAALGWPQITKMQLERIRALVANPA